MLEKHSSYSLMAMMVLVYGLQLTSFAVEDQKSIRTVFNNTHWIPGNAPPDPKVVYGRDDRIDVYEETDPQILEWAASVCGLFSPDSITENSDNTYTIQGNSYDVCEDEPFANQPAVAFCTGFMAGEDIIVTAGHCFGEGDLGQTLFVFGFVMENPTTPTMTVTAEQVYVGVEILGRALRGDSDDYCVVRVDRPIATPRAVPLPIRRQGGIAIGEQVGAIGHPAGLPLKISFGKNTFVREISEPGYFLANLDTYSGNSGSPIFNSSTGIVEGILVRGELDFVFDEGCRRSNILLDTGGDGETVVKATTFMQYVPELATGAGSLSLDRSSYQCEDMLYVTLRDHDLTGAVAIELECSTSNGDLQVVNLSESGDATGVLVGTLAISDGAVELYNGILEAGEGDTIQFSYQDMSHGNTGPKLVTATAFVDCTPPSVVELSLPVIRSTFAVISFLTDEIASGKIRFGTECGDLIEQQSFNPGRSHQVTLTELKPSTNYSFVLQIADDAGNNYEVAEETRCFTFTTRNAQEFDTEVFSTHPP